MISNRSLFSPTVVSEGSFQFLITVNGEGRSARHGTLVLLLIRAAQPLVRPMIVCLCICMYQSVCIGSHSVHNTGHPITLYIISREWLATTTYREKKEIRPVSLSVWFLFLYLYISMNPSFLAILGKLSFKSVLATILKAYYNWKRENFCIVYSVRLY